MGAISLGGKYEGTWFFPDIEKLPSKIHIFKSFFVFCLFGKNKIQNNKNEDVVFVLNGVKYVLTPKEYTMKVNKYFFYYVRFRDL